VLHARIASSMETLYADRLGEQVERLAHHAARGELGEKAVVYLRQAGAKAFTTRPIPMPSPTSPGRRELLATLEPARGEIGRKCPAARLGRPPAMRGYATPEVEQNYRGLGSWRTRSAGRSSSSRPRWGIWLVASHRANADHCARAGSRAPGARRASRRPRPSAEGPHALWPVLVWLGKGRRGAHHLIADGTLRQGAAPEPRISLWRPRPRRVLPEGCEAGRSAPRLPARGLEGKRRFARAGQGARISMSMAWRSSGRACFATFATRVPGGPEHRVPCSPSRPRTTSHSGSRRETIIDGPPAPSSARERRRSPRSSVGSRPRIDGAQLFLPYFLSLWPARARRSASLTRSARHRRGAGERPPDR